MGRKKFELTDKGKRLAKAGICWVCDGEYVNIGGEDLEVTIRESKDTPEHTRKYVAASQKHLKAFYELGAKDIVKIVESKEQPKTESKPKAENSEDK